MTDNGSAWKSFAYESFAYESFAFRDLLAEHSIRHKRTRPYTPRTNGKAERFIQTSLRESAYAQAYDTSGQRTAALAPWMHRYTTTRPDSAISIRHPCSD